MLTGTVTRGSIGHIDRASRQIVTGLERQRRHGTGAAERVQAWGRWALVGTFQELAILPHAVAGSRGGTVSLLARLPRGCRLSRDRVGGWTGLIDGRVESGHAPEIKSGHGFGRVLCPRAGWLGGD